MITVERADHFFNSDEAANIKDVNNYHEVYAAASEFLARTGISIDADELARDFQRRV